MKLPRFFLVYAPELLLMDISPGMFLDEDTFKRWADGRFDDRELGRFIELSVPGDFLQTKDLTVVRLGNGWNEN